VSTDPLSWPLSPLLISLSDGWDRTAQVCATAELLLDPYYRTIEGLCVLIEKDWCSFGHKFHDRIGHGDRNLESSERSPVFIQWLDVLHQLLLQFPNQFEYQETLLIFIADAVYSCQFGTFLGNCQKEREVGHLSCTWSLCLILHSLNSPLNIEQSQCGLIFSSMLLLGPILAM
jgi:myotubularin-related protein 3/4